MPVLEVASSFLHGKCGVEIRIWSRNGDNTHSWLRISHGSNEFVMDLKINDTEIPEDQLEESSALKLSAKDLWTSRRQKQKQNHKEENLLTLHQESFPLKEGIGSTLNQGNILSPRMRFRRKWFIFFVTRRKYIEKRTERLIFGERTSSESISTYLLVGWALESLLGSRRRSKKKISVLLW